MKQGEKIFRTDSDVDAGGKERKQESADYYDLVVDVLVLPTLDYQQSGWNVEIKQEGRDIIKKFNKPDKKPFSTDEVNQLSLKLLPTDADRPRVSVVGLFDRGKTHLINKLAQIKLQSSRRINTRGISIKLPEKGVGEGFVLLDTAGTNVPMDRQSIQEHINQLNKLKPWVPKIADIGLFQSEEISSNEEPDPDIDVDTIVVDESNGAYFEVDELMGMEDPTKVAEIKAELKAHESEVAMKARNKAIINKQATEMFLQELIFHLSDVVIVVVNELTFDDQLYIELLSRKLTEANAMNPLYVVHNYKDTVTEEQLLELRDKYICSCYEGKLDKSQSGDIVTHFFQNKDHKMVHVWLGKEEDPVNKVESIAGNKYNNATYEFLRARIRAARKEHENTLLYDLASISVRALRELSFFKEIAHIDYFPGEKGLVMKGRSLPQPVKNQPKKVYFPELKLAPDDVIQMGKMLVMQLSSDFSPPIDICYTRDCMTVVVDLPGFTASEALSMDVSKNTLKPPSLDQFSHELLITGTRKLCWRYADSGPADAPGKSASVRIPLSNTRVHHYASSDEGVHVERKYGFFSRKILVPREYYSSKPIQWNLQYGVLQVLILKDDIQDDDDSLTIK